MLAQLSKMVTVRNDMQTGEIAGSCRAITCSKTQTCSRMTFKLLSNRSLLVEQALVSLTE
ncbi:hypothetical protein KSI01_25310 [Kurthia sibirica]|uniref:Uncharacterized protein n=1 Tax=Kurthia sibirica TaxID=202750 RepID=A0A2U3ANA0_9BACL|nr:hypothetical protein DEX24_05410 [Kurthia sibirica]GEK34998.1 hypothetical protein KSI01_25310 [Kurthia sibirica]